MNSQLHLLIVTTLSMIMTFGLYYSLKDTRANDLYLQRTLIDVTGDSILFLRCLFNSEKINKTCNFPSADDKSTKTLFIWIAILLIILYILGLYQNYCFMYCLMHTITASWFFARFCNGFHIWCEFDIITVYFINWQWMSLITEWEKEYLPPFSLNIYRTWLCISTAFEAFFFFDAIFRYFPLWMNFGYIWISSVEDIIACLYVKGRLYKRKPFKKISKDIRSIPSGFYYTWDVYDKRSYRHNDRLALGLGDFVMFNIMLLFVLNPLLPIIENICIAIGHVIAIQIGERITHRLGIRYNQYSQPGLPLPVITFSVYAMLLYLFFQY